MTHQRYDRRAQRQLYALRVGRRRPPSEVDGPDLGILGRWRVKSRSGAEAYIRTARAKGLGPIRVLIHHAFRNTLIPFVTLLGLTLPGLLGGAIILEGIFNWQGMGLLFFESILGRDYQTIMSLTLMFSILTLSGQLLADILYAFVDPRIRYS